MAIQRALLLIADIGGYTRFMSVHRVSLAHAQDVVGQLLESVIDAAVPAFKVAKLEGDAVFLYAELPAHSSEKLRELADRVRHMRAAFALRRLHLGREQLCNCDACVKVDDLNLKFVSHVGEVATQRVKKFNELAGMDVIIVHRLLKNSVPVKEYVLMTDPVFTHLGDDVRGFAKPLTEDLEGVGATSTHYIDLDSISELALPELRPSFWARFRGWLAMTLRTIPYILGFRKPCGGFKNLEVATSGLLAAPHAHAEE